MKKNIFVILLLSLVITGCETIPQSTKTPLELQSIQSKEFETTKKIAFAATLSVLQDLGYIVDSASFETGLITAKSPTKNKFVPFVGQKMSLVKTTAFVEEINSGRTKIRTNFVNSVSTSSGYGMKTENEVPLETPDTYQDFFAKVQQGIFIRKNL